MIKALEDKDALNSELVRIIEKKEYLLAKTTLQAQIYLNAAIAGATWITLDAIDLVVLLTTDHGIGFYLAKLLGII